MGVLDDAIREHLELKRRHGASEEEIARKETEALGPARRGPAADAAEPAKPAEPAEPALSEPPVDPAFDDAAPFDSEPAPLIPDEPAATAAPVAPLAETEPVAAGEDAAPAPVEPTIDVPAEPEPPAGIEPAAAEPDLPPVHEVDRDPLEPPPPAPRPEPGATVEFDALSARDDDEEPPPGDEDVLEETPEFLRETPEHDRLWFEQKPPRDFDLDN